MKSRFANVSKDRSLADELIAERHEAAREETEIKENLAKKILRNLNPQ